MSQHFDGLSEERVRRILNVLVEAPFFYRSDDPELFAYLRRRRGEFRRFYQELYGWELVIDEHAARLYKPRWYNPALRRSQHDVFDLTRKGECIAFLLMLEFYEHLLDADNVAVDDPELPRFTFGQLFSFAVQRYAEEVGPGAPGEEDVRKLLRHLMPVLERYRFVRALEPPADLAAGMDRDAVIYECLPALHHYDVSLLGPKPLAELLGVAPEAKIAAEPEAKIAAEPAAAQPRALAVDAGEPDREEA